MTSANHSASPRYQALVAAIRPHVRELSVMALRENAAPPGRILVDVREADEHAAGHIPGSLHLSRGILETEIEQRIPDLDTPIVCYCAGGNRSILAADNLVKMGYRNVMSLQGGFREWSRIQAAQP